MARKTAQVFVGAARAAKPCPGIREYGFAACAAPTRRPHATLRQTGWTRTGRAGTLPPMDYGLRRHLPQVLHQLLQVALVGMTLGAMRTVVPALAEAEFGVPRGSFVLLTAFVLAFGLVKGAMNFLAGRLAETHGRRRVLLWGWALALPIAPLVYFAPAWSWVVAATVLLGVQQGLCWSMTQTAKLDLTRADQRGWVIGLNEFAGYAGMAVAGVLAALAAQRLGTRPGVLVFGLAVAMSGLAHAALAARVTLPWARPAAHVGGA
jgi:MFS family permease